MVLRRLGNKSKLAKDIIPLFPKHDMYIELFFGAGGIFFNKPVAKYNVLNDLDDDVYNLYTVISNDFDKFYVELEIVPLSQTLLKYWSKNKETEPIKKAIRFLFLSNAGLLGGDTSLHIGRSNDKHLMIKNLLRTKDFLLKNNNTIMFTNDDFRKCLSNISYRHEYYLDSTFAYADPPYLNTANNYSTDKFTKQDFIDLLDMLINERIKFAVSEFGNEFVINEAEKRNLFINQIGERQTLKNRNTEILITNYEI
jgi:DNA adenine methylase